jgi:DNA-binding IclR family transcriptional regulator
MVTDSPHRRTVPPAGVRPEAPRQPDRAERRSERLDRPGRRLAGRDEVPVKGTLHSVERALRALELVARTGDGITAKAVARRLGCTLSTSYNVLNTLVAAGYLVRLPDARGYGLGYQVADLAEVLWDELRVTSDVRNVVTRLHVEADAAAYLAVYRDADVVVGYVADSASRPRVPPLDVGYAQGAHATAYGKVLLAALPPERRRAVLDRTGLPAYTRNTICDPRRLHAELDALRDAAVAVQVEEYRAGIACLAAPVRRPDGAVVGALAVSVPVGRFAAARPALESALPRFAAEVAHAMASSGTWRDEAARSVLLAVSGFRLGGILGLVPSAWATEDERDGAVLLPCWERYGDGYTGASHGPAGDVQER